MSRERDLKEDSKDSLTPEEIADVKEAWNEIKRGEAKRFENVEDFLRDLKEDSKE